MENKETPLDLESIKKQFLEQFRSSKPLSGKGGSFAPLFKQFLEAALEAELENHLADDQQKQSSYRKNGKVSKTLKTSDGQVELVTSRDRNGSFEPEIVKKGETILADSLQDRIIGMYGIGMSLSDISQHIKEMYDMDISHDDDVLLKLIYLAHKNISKKWTQALQNWGLTVSQLSIHFEGRFTLM